MHSSSIKPAAFLNIYVYSIRLKIVPGSIILSGAKFDFECLKILFLVMGEKMLQEKYLAQIGIDYGQIFKSLKRDIEIIS